MPSAEKDARLTDEERARVWDECTDAHHVYAVRQGLAFAHPPNPYRVTPPAECGQCGRMTRPNGECWSCPIPPAGNGGASDA